MIPYGKHYLDQSDINAVVKALKKPFLTQGPTVESLEKKFVKLVGAKYAVAVSSCTAGLHIAGIAAGLKPKQTLLTSAITFVSSPNSAIFSGADVILADVDKNDININSNTILRAIKKNKSKKIKVIMPVHFAGSPCDMKEIKKIAIKQKSVVVEDAAHALGSKYKCGSYVGSCKYSLMTVFSLHPVKTISAGEGGIVTTNSFAIYKKLLRLRSHGINKSNDQLLNLKFSKTKNIANPWYYEMQEIGFNYRITDFQCALAISQMKKLDKFLKKRKILAYKYDQYFKSSNKITSLQTETRKLSGHHIYPVNIDFQKTKLSRAEIMIKLRKNKIITQVHYIPIPIHPFYKKKGYKESDYPNAMNYYNQALTLPLYYDLNFKQQKYIIDTLNKLIIMK